jgi:cyclophilin family peptidyl-prolyl cis-trans isomerase
LTRPPAGGRVLAAALATLVLLVGCNGALPGVTPVACPSAAPTAEQATEILDGVTGVTVDTTLGSFTITLNPTSAPIAAANFVALASCGFYDGITFHRVLTGFVIQSGDPNTKENQGDFEGLGTGGPGYRFATEVPPEGVNYDPYTVAMANARDPNTNGSQFFVCLTDLDSQFPERNYSIFGSVTEGQDVVDAIGLVEVNHPNLGVPVDPVVINGMEVLGAESTPS